MESKTEIKTKTKQKRFRKKKKKKRKKQTPEINRTKQKRNGKYCLTEKTRIKSQ